MERTIEELVMERVEDLNIEGMVSSEIKRIIEKRVSEAIKKETETKVGGIITAEIVRQMSVPVETDDGWGKKSKYESFEDLFRKTFADKLNASWQVKQEIERWVKGKCDEVIKSKQQEITKRIAEELTKA